MSNDINYDNIVYPEVFVPPEIPYERVAFAYDGYEHYTIRMPDDKYCYKVKLYWKACGHKMLDHHGHHVKVWVKKGGHHGECSAKKRGRCRIKKIKKKIDGYCRICVTNQRYQEQGQEGALVEQQLANQPQADSELDDSDDDGDDDAI